LQGGKPNACIEEIAYACGFNDLSTFYRSFKTRYGTKPSSIRQESL
jgi:AraC-like DNA-binding protein